ncbi:class I tRNA ligase family protein [Streptomyces sp. A 4/2]|uniref:class I tRNA ligase family protein n=1 Tax=Streptomyces sp. A 4/2 TaxID=2934314 RepID=UPI002024D365|nr:class I tRNA ligase family protein [Streptomyces sp. A 4/2]
MSALLTGDAHVPKHYLLVPPEATPNGPLHLGHIGGPFLWADMIARHLRVRGDLPLVITGSDVYESYVALTAHAEGSTPSEVAARYGRRIQDDLAALRIGIDTFISPDQEPWRDLFEAEVATASGRLKDRGAVLSRTERVPYCAASDRWVVGGWLLGRCPECGAGVASYFCEECSAHFLPESVVEPRPLLDEGPLTWREISSLFLRVPERDVLDAALARLDIARRYRRSVARFLERDGLTLRLSAPQTWGVPLPAPEAGVPHALFPYAGIFMFARLAGAVHGQLSGTGVNAFDPDSGVTTITTLGIDNVIPTLVGIVGTSLLHGDMKPYDRCLVNHFYRLAGRKFSTSARHAIWASDIAAAPTIGADTVRYFLARADLESGPASFESADFLTTARVTLADGLGKRLDTAWTLLPDGPPRPPAPAVADLLESLLAEQSAALDSSRISTARAVAALDRWCADDALIHSAEDGAYWWLKGVCLLGFPVVPDLAEQLWLRLGGTGEPTAAAFLRPTPPDGTPAAPGFVRAEADDLDACMPLALRSGARS